MLQRRLERAALPRGAGQVQMLLEGVNRSRGRKAHEGLSGRARDSPTRKGPV
jgi:hypothetical protein